MINDTLLKLCINFDLVIRLIHRQNSMNKSLNNQYFESLIKWTINKFSDDVKTGLHVKEVLKELLLLFQVEDFLRSARIDEKNISDFQLLHRLRWKWRREQSNSFYAYKPSQKSFMLLKKFIVFVI